jgi:integrating conjugative element membrane protein (TIGR03747 family)
MTTNRPVENKVKTKPKTLFGKWMSATFNVAIISMLSWFLLIIWFGLSLFKQNQAMVVNQISEMSYETLYFILNSHSLLSRYLAMTLVDINGTLHTLTILFTNMLGIIFHKLPATYANRVQSDIVSMMAFFFEITEIIIERLILFIMNIPLLACFVFVFLVDGLGQRDIRKFSGARESTFFFHRIKPITGKLFYLLVFIFMSSPYVITPVILFLPMAVLLGFIMMLTVKSFKKYV